MCRDMVVGLLKVLLKEPNLILHRGDQTFHLGIRLFLQDLLYSPSRGDHIFQCAAPQLLYFCGQRSLQCTQKRVNGMTLSRFLIARV